MSNQALQKPIQLIVGLGNPGSQYAQTRHNAGAWFVQTLAEHYHSPLKVDSKFHGALAKAIINQRDCWLLLPSTYMNHSGKAVASLAHYYHIPPEAILIAHDELDLPVGSARLKQGGGHAGHNGLRDVISALGGNRNFARLRIGIGHPGDKNKVTDYVLSSPGRQDKDAIDSAIDDAVHYVPNIISGDFESVMKDLHT